MTKISKPEIKQQTEIPRTLTKESIINDIGSAALALIMEYSRTWHLLLQYDENKLALPKGTEKAQATLDIKEVTSAILNLKQQLITIGEATELFGIDRGNNLSSILNNIEQTFGGHALYPTVESRAAHLLYFIIKDHPFVDGNKRIGCFLFVLYLRLNNIELVKINDVSLTALALLVAESNPSEKELIIKLVNNLIM
jgi:DNA ligase (NAD+)